MKCKCFSDQHNKTQQSIQSFTRPNCSIFPLLNFMAFPHNAIHFNSFPSVHDGDILREVQKMAQEMASHKERICNVNRERRRILSEEVGMDVFSPISLSDVFSVLQSVNYPLLWQEYVKIHTIFPTTVSCEQTFSVIKRTNHVNMKQKKLIANVTNKLHERAETKWFWENGNGNYWKGNPIPRVPWHYLSGRTDTVSCLSRWPHPPRKSSPESPPPTRSTRAIPHAIESQDALLVPARLPRSLKPSGFSAPRGRSPMLLVIVSGWLLVFSFFRSVFEIKSLSCWEVDMRRAGLSEWSRTRIWKGFLKMES